MVALLGSGGAMPAHPRAAARAPGGHQGGGRPPPMGGCRCMWQRIAGLVVCGLVLYGVAPAVLDVLDEWPQVVDIQPYWFVAMIVAQVGSWAGLWLLQRLAVDCHSWWPVITSNLASSAIGRVVPGGAAAAGAMQFRRLVQAGVAPSLAGLGITVAGIVVLAALAALPVLALPPI